VPRRPRRRRGWRLCHRSRGRRGTCRPTARPRAVVGEHRDPARYKQSVEPVRLLAKRVARSGDVDDGRVRARYRRHRQRSGERGPAAPKPHLVVVHVETRACARRWRRERAGRQIDGERFRGEAVAGEAHHLDVRQREVAERVSALVRPRVTVTVAVPRPVPQCPRAWSPSPSGRRRAASADRARRSAASRGCASRRPEPGRHARAQA